MRISTNVLAETAVLGALVIVLDYAMKFSGFKIIFPWYTVLKFDFTGIPIVLSYLILGITSGATTSIIASLGILVRSGDIIGASMKGIAEFATVLGMAIGIRLVKNPKRLSKITSFILGILSRTVIMIILNLLLIFSGLMILRGSYSSIPLLVSLLVGAFNAVQGSISMFGGYIIYEALLHRVPSLIPREKIDRNR